MFTLLHCTLLASLTTSAMPMPKVDFSADGTLQLPQMSVTTKMYFTPGKERREHVINGSNQVTIVRHDLGVVWILLPQANMYMEISLKQAEQSVGTFPQDATMARNKVGDETINGVAAGKYSITVTQKDGATLNGLAWFSKEDIIVKLDATTKGNGTSTQPLTFKMELNNVRIAKQPPSLFDIPAGFTKMAAGGDQIGAQISP